MKYRKYTTDDHPGRDPIVANPVIMPTWRVVARRAKGSAGRLTAMVRAWTEEEARKKILEGEEHGLGLGWIPIKVEQV